jgi:NAD(P)-dependent dehydrogenase (short-subunit alcohol dehydrogenase family)
MKGKTVIITGANSGIGKETTREIAKRGAKVIMACRNLDTAQRARDEIVHSTGNGEVFVKKLDLSSLKSIREFADDINRTVTKLDVLVHNAGTAHTFGPKTTEDGLELTMATNHFGPFLLTHLLIDLLKRSAPSRIVIVASELYRLSCLNMNNLNPVDVFPAYLYYVSKYANIVFSQELARRLEGTGVTANCLHPGMIDSGIWRNVPFPLNLPLKIIIKGFFKSPEQGAQTTIHLAVSESLEGVSGKYFLDCKEHTLSSRAKNPATAKKLWEESEKFVDLQPNDPHI